MAKDTRVAGIYSEIKYKFDPKSLKVLKQFRKDITGLKKDLQSLNKLKVSPKVQMSGAKEARSMQVRNKATKAAINLEQRLAMVKRKRRAFEGKLSAAGVTGGELGRSRSAFNKVSGSFSKGKKSSGEFNNWLETQYDKLIPKAKRLKAEEKRITREKREQQRAMKALSAYFGRVNTQAKMLSTTSKKTGMTFKQMRGSMVGMIQAYTAFSALGNINKTGQDFENAGIMMETALGENAAPAMAFLVQQSRRLGIDAAESAKGFARYALAARELGFSLGDIKEQFLGVAEAATVFGLSQDQITGTIRALEQMASKGKIMSEELKLQLGDRMPAVMQIAAKSVNMTTDQFLKAMEEGKISAEEFLPAFSSAMRDLAAPGLDKAFKSVSFAQKKMTAEWKLFKNSLFTAGLDQLFKALFHSIEDLLVVMKPFAVFLVAALSAFIRGVLFPIRLVIALIADIFDAINFYMQKFLGFDLADTFETLGSVLGSVMSIIAGGIGAIAKGVRWIVANSFVFKMVGIAFRTASKAANRLFSIVSKIVDKLRSIPIIGNLFKGDVSGAASKVAEGAKKLNAGKGMDKFLNSGTMLGGMVGVGDTLSKMATGKSIIELVLTDDAKDNFKAKVNNQTDNLNINTRG